MSKIDLITYLSRKRTTIQELVKLLKIKNYEEIVSYCDRRGCTPITRDQFDTILPKEDLQYQSFEATLDTDKIEEPQEMIDDKSVKKDRKKRKSKSSSSS